MAPIVVSEDLHPLTDLKTKPNALIQQAHDTGRPVVLTRYGKGVAVLLSVRAYEELEEAAARLRLFSALVEADAAAARGEVVEQSEVDPLLEG